LKALSLNGDPFLPCIGIEGLGIDEHPPSRTCEDCGFAGLVEHFSKFNLLMGKNEWKRRSAPAKHCEATTDQVASTVQSCMIATAEQRPPGRGEELHLFAARSSLWDKLEGATHGMLWGP
jgi:hypothetical protein